MFAIEHLLRLFSRNDAILARLWIISNVKENIAQEYASKISWFLP